MDSRLLRYFVEVAELRSFSKAAITLRIGQPALSKAVNQLEQQLDVKLFHRTNRGLELTQPGRRLADRGSELLRNIAQLREEVVAHSRHITGTVLLAVPPTAGQALIPRLFEHVGRKWPDIRIDVTEGLSADAFDVVLSGKAAIGLLYDPRPHRDLTIVPLVTEDMCLLGPKSRAPQSAPIRSLRKIARLPLILPSRPNSRRMLLERAFAEENLIINLYSEVDSYSVTRALIEAGRGYTIWSQSAANSELHRGTMSVSPIRNARLRWTLSLAVRNERKRNPAIDAVLNAIRQEALALVAQGVWQGTAKLD